MIMYMEFEWDEHNKEKNKLKHSVDWFEAEEIFANVPIIFFYDTKHSRSEVRYVAFGKTDGGRLLLVVFTVRGQKVRVISARDQNKKEREYYKSN
jgi:uncharacterized DUF497 family protein